MGTGLDYFAGLVPVTNQHLSQMATSVLDLDRLTEMILEDVTETMHIRSGAFLIKEETGGEYHLKVHRGIPDLCGQTLFFRKDHPVVVWLAARRTSLPARALQLDPGFIGLWRRERQDLDQALFEKFYRAKAAQEAGIRGTGLGLVLVKQAVEAHGATIAVESRRGEGARFTVIFPLPARLTGALPTTHSEPEVSCSEAATSMACTSHSEE